MFAIKAEVVDLNAETLAFLEQKTMYGGRRIAAGDRIFVFASENEGGPGLVSSGIVLAAEAIPKKLGLARQTPRVSITVRRTALAKRRLGGAGSGQRSPGCASEVFAIVVTAADPRGLCGMTLPPASGATPSSRRRRATSAATIALPSGVRWPRPHFV